MICTIITESGEEINLKPSSLSRVYKKVDRERLAIFFKELEDDTCSCSFLELNDGAILRICYSNNNRSHLKTTVSTIWESSIDDVIMFG